MSIEAQHDDSSAGRHRGEPVRGWRGVAGDRRYAEGTDGYRRAMIKAGRRAGPVDSTDLFQRLARPRYSDEPCGRPGCRGCSACIRRAAADYNLERYGSVDFPGVTGWRDRDAA